MAYTGKKPVDFVDVTESQTFKVTDGSLTLKGDGPTLQIFDTDTALSDSELSGKIEFYQSDLSGAGVGASIGAYGDGSTGALDLRFSTNNDTEAMRIDSSGNLLVGKTVTDGDTAGARFNSSGFLHVTRATGRPVIFQRNTSDGSILEFRRDSASTVAGYVGVYSSRLYVATPYSSDSGLRFDSKYIAPCSTSGVNRDNTIDLGHPDARFDDIRATNGTIQTSDQNEKQQIASLTAAEITAAKAISKLFKTFKWNDSVTENGDNARTHTGVIAQDVQQAMTNAGLNAADYAFWCSDTWWESNGETYDTQADAPVDATERTRLGIRYPELLAFVGAATEQRLADIETRLTALEAAE